MFSNGQQQAVILVGKKAKKSKENLPVSRIIVEHSMEVAFSGSYDDVGAVHWVKVELWHVLVRREVT